jgi:hypothetical protein
MNFDNDRAISNLILAHLAKKHGSVTILTDVNGTVNKPCVKCGCTEFRVSAGKGPHAAAVHCSGCSRFNKWLSRSALQQLLVD